MARSAVIEAEGEVLSAAGPQRSGSSAQRVMSEALSFPEIDAFIDAIWLEEGLSKNTLSAYRRDLSLFGRWLAGQGKAIDATAESDLNAYFAARHSQTRATSANRRLTVFKRYFRWALRERVISTDPTLKLQSAKQPLRVPKTLSEAQVETLLAAPEVDMPLGLRDRAMLELMYASGLRVSELVGLKTFSLGMNEGVLRVLGKGSKERLVPFGQIARDWLVRYLAEARGAILAGQQTEDLFVTARGHGMTRVMFWIIVKKHALGLASPRRCRRTPCATRSPRTCSIMAPTCGRCRCCWATSTFPPPRSTPTSPASG